VKRLVTEPIAQAKERKAMRESFRLYSHLRDGGINRRYHKFRYTAALRLGVVPEDIGGVTEFSFEGQPHVEIDAHNDNESFLGSLRVNGQLFSDIVFIAKKKAAGRYNFITFWPVVQHPDAHKSYTDPLVDTAMDGTPFDIEVVAEKMHKHFAENAGVSPATLMKMIYEDANESIRFAAEKLGTLLDEALEISKQESERANRERDRADKLAGVAEGFKQDAEHHRKRSAELEKENEELKKAAYIVPPPNEQLVISKKIKLVRAFEGVQGKFNQRAVMLEMSDGTTRSNNWATGLDARLAYAKSLEGQYITTDVWGGYDGKKWFKNIYLADQ